MRWQYVSVARSQAWNAALSVAEAGVEEAMAQLNPSALIFSTNIDRGANGWSLQADGMYHAQRETLTNGYYDVAVTADAYPVIYATGYVTIPTLSTTVTRSVKLGTGVGALFRGPLAARVNVDLKGNKITTDSFDSMDPAHSTTNGLYDPATRKAGGDIASTDGIVNVQNANVMGTLYTGPGGSYTINAQGSVGDVAWVSGGNTGVEPGHFKNDFNMDFPAVAPPYSTGAQATGGTVGTNSYAWILGSDNYIYTGSSASFKSGDTILVTGAARMYVTGNFSMSSGSTLIIAPGARLELYVAGTTTSISTVNNSGNCNSFTYFGLPGNTSITLSGNDSFLGSIYAPNADLTLNGGGSNTLDYQGAISVNTIHMNGHFNLHFDENLKRGGPVRGYQITSWSEL